MLKTAALCVALATTTLLIPTTAAAEGLKVGEYACYGFGGRLQIGLSFIVLPGGRYTDLDKTSSGTIAINGETVVFHGGHLDGQTGLNLKEGRFTLHAIVCEPYE